MMLKWCEYTNSLEIILSKIVEIVNFKSCPIQDEHEIAVVSNTK